MYKSSDLDFLDFIYIFTSLRAVAEQYGGFVVGFFAGGCLYKDKAWRIWK